MQLSLLSGLADMTSSGHSNKPLLVLLFAVMALVLATVIVAIIKSKQAKSRDKRLLVKVGRAFDPAKPISGALLFILLFAMIGGGYEAYNSYAGTCADATTLSIGSSGQCVKYAQMLLNGVYAGDHIDPIGGYISGGYLATDGNYGSQTSNQAKDFQKWTKFSVSQQDGIVGPHTWFALCNYAYAAGEIASTARSSYVKTAFAAGINAGCPSDTYNGQRVGGNWNYYDKQ